MPLDRENSATLFDCQHELAAAYLASQVGRLRLFVPTSPAYSLVCHDERTAVREGSALRPDPTIAKRGRQLWATSPMQILSWGPVVSGQKVGRWGRFHRFAKP